MNADRPPQNSRSFNRPAPGSVHEFLAYGMTVIEMEDQRLNALMPLWSSGVPETEDPVEARRFASYSARSQASVTDAAEQCLRAHLPSGEIPPALVAEEIVKTRTLIRLELGDAAPAISENDFAALMRRNSCLVVLLMAIETGRRASALADALNEDADRHSRSRYGINRHHVARGLRSAFRNTTISQPCEATHLASRTLFLDQLAVFAALRRIYSDHRRNEPACRLRGSELAAELDSRVPLYDRVEPARKRGPDEAREFEPAEAGIIARPLSG